MYFSAMYTDCFYIASRSSARGRQTTLRWQKQVFVHIWLSRAYLALARLSCIMLQTVFSAELMLDVLLRKKLRCSFSIARVPTLLFISWKPVRLTSIRLPLLTLSLTDFLWNCLRPITLKLSKRAKNF